MHEWNPDEYEKHSSAQKTWGEGLIGKLRLSGNEDVLDIGCGDGALTVEIAARLPGGSVTGIDYSAEMIAHATARYPASGYPNCRFACVDAREISYESEFDIAFSNAALHWVPEQDRVLAAVFRALKPGGRILFQMGGKGNVAEFFAMADLVTAEYPWKSYFAGFFPTWRFFSDREYEELLDEAGFVQVRSELIPVDMIHPDRIGLEGWIRTTWLPFLEKLPNCKKEEFITEIADRYLSLYPPDAAGRTHVKMIRLEVEAVKRI